MHDFYSDTKSIPTKTMLESIVLAPLGDEQRAEDPTTAMLEERVAKVRSLLNKQHLADGHVSRLGSYSFANIFTAKYAVCSVERVQNDTT